MSISGKIADGAVPKTAAISLPRCPCEEIFVGVLGLPASRASSSLAGTGVRADANAWRLDADETEPQAR